MPPYVCVCIEYRNGGVGVRDTKGNAGGSHALGKPREVDSEFKVDVDNGQGQSTKQSALKR